jgi:hypothetical protein
MTISDVSNSIDILSGNIESVGVEIIDRVGQVADYLSSMDDRIDDQLTDVNEALEHYLSETNLHLKSIADSLSTMSKLAVRNFEKQNRGGLNTKL